MEREHKYLVRSLPSDLHEHPHELIEQGYLAVEKGPREAEVRIRKHSRQWVLTVKVGSGEVREEKEVPIPTSHARSLWPLTRGRRVKKTR